jgi:hypothetical protein
MMISIASKPANTQTMLRLHIPTHSLVTVIVGAACAGMNLAMAMVYFTLPDSLLQAFTSCALAATCAAFLPKLCRNVSRDMARTLTYTVAPLDNDEKAPGRPVPMMDKQEG